MYHRQRDSHHDLSLHAARQVLLLSRRTTILIPGNEQLSINITTAITTPGIKVYSRPFEKLVKGSKRAEVIIQFDHDTINIKAQLVHKSKTVIRGDLNLNGIANACNVVMKYSENSGTKDGSPND
ncbi:hypothetical protein BPAE_0017g00830 [Botrytis paeoniae]|uniref:Uncharacterized protein n=1 Tax=Botrytis paeoniae TaxID=278948 RepID=A0A4Z1FXN2_9HELO|nr:hypothetical protein BPAE_0017g00830 [Botrytis paeoniae]